MPKTVDAQDVDQNDIGHPIVDAGSQGGYENADEAER